MVKLSLILGLLLGTASWSDPLDDGTAQKIREQSDLLEKINVLEKGLRQRFIRVSQQIEADRPTSKKNAVAESIVGLKAVPSSGLITPISYTKGLKSISEVTEEASALVTQFLGPEPAAPPPSTTEGAPKIQVPASPEQRFDALKVELDKLGKDRLDEDQTISVALEKARDIVRQKQQQGTEDELPAPSGTAYVSYTGGVYHEDKDNGGIPTRLDASSENLLIEQEFKKGAEIATKYFGESVSSLGSLVDLQNRIEDMRTNPSPGTKSDTDPPPESPPPTGDRQPPGEGPQGLGDNGPPPGGPGGGDPGAGGLGQEDPGAGQGQGEPEQSAEDPNAGQPQEAKPEEPPPDEKMADDSSKGGGGGGQGGGGGGANGSSGGTGGGSAPTIPFGSGAPVFSASRSGADIDTTPIAKAGRVVTLDNAPPKFPEAGNSYVPALPPVVPSFPNRGGRSIASVGSLGRSSQNPNSQTGGTSPLGGVTPPNSSAALPDGNPLAAAQAALASGGGPSAVGSNFQGNLSNPAVQLLGRDGSGIKTQRAAYGGGGGEVNDEVAPKQVRILKRQDRAEIIDASAFNEELGLGKGIMSHVGTWCKKSHSRSVDLCDADSSSLDSKTVAGRTPATKTPKKK